MIVVHTADVETLLQNLDAVFDAGQRLVRDTLFFDCDVTEINEACIENTLYLSACVEGDEVFMTQEACGRDLMHQGGHTKGSERAMQLLTEVKQYCEQHSLQLLHGRVQIT